MAKRKFDVYCQKWSVNDLDLPKLIEEKYVGSTYAVSEAQARNNVIWRSAKIHCSPSVRLRYLAKEV